MNLYIETENGAVKNHPAFEHNLMQAFGSIPAHWEPFIRVERPTPTMYQVLESNEPVYTKINDVWTDVWLLREMTTQEKEDVRQAAIKAKKEAWAARVQVENWSAWVFNEEAIKYEPPIPRPDPDVTKLDQRIYTFWSGADANWKDTPVRPEGDYTFDFIAWQWVEAVN
jgi:hypothetical protein